MVEPSRIPLRVRLAYSMGHLQNDLMASMWFSYLLVYLHKVRDFNSIYAGTLLLVGQIADAIATPLVGYEADATSGCCGYTKRKSWHAFGLVCTTIAFPFIFAPVIGATENTPDYAKFIYYAAFVVIFQIGWASVQISHLSLIPQLTNDKSEVAGLNGWRYAATGIANLTTYAIAWVILSSPGDSTVGSQGLGPGDADHFRNLGFAVTAIGVVASLIFHLGVPEPKTDDTPAASGSEDPERKGVAESIGESYGSTVSRVKEDDENTSLLRPVLNRRCTAKGPKRRGVCQWFSDVRFYQVALIYMCTRLYVNISQVYLPMYLTETIKLDKVTIANVPLVCYASSFVTSTLLKIVDRQLGRKLTYVFGLVVAGVASIFVYFIPMEDKWMVYTAAVLIGMGGALMLITSLSFVADLIGEFTGSSAFVYGSMSFTDKLANGVAVEIVQIFHPCVKCCPACSPYYRHVQSFVPGGSALLAFVGLLTLLCCSAPPSSTSYETVDSAESQSNGSTIQDPSPVRANRELRTCNGEVIDQSQSDGNIVRANSELRTCNGEVSHHPSGESTVEGHTNRSPGPSPATICTVAEVHTPQPILVRNRTVETGRRNIQE